MGSLLDLASFPHSWVCNCWSFYLSLFQIIKFFEIIEPRSPALQAESLPAEPPGKLYLHRTCSNLISNEFTFFFFLVYVLPKQVHEFTFYLVLLELDSFLVDWIEIEFL